MKSLIGKTALVLGAGSKNNIGQAIAARYAHEGASVMVAGRDTDELARFARSIGGHSCRCDITNEQDLARLVSETRSKLGGFDIAVNATGLNQVKPFLDVKPAELQKVVDVQFVGLFLFLQAVLRNISDGGSVIQISSVSAKAFLPDHAAYMATKAAGDILVGSLAAEFGHRGIRINSIAPGATEDSPMAADVLMDANTKESIRKSIPLGRIGRAADIADAALWLAGDQSFITGEVLQINGGRAIHTLA